MARRSFPSRPMVAARKRTSQWLNLVINEVAVAANTKLLVVTLGAQALALRPFTIVRTHLRYTWLTDQVAAFENPLGALGMIVVSDTAAAVGVTAVPDTIANADGNWYLWEPLVYDMIFASGGFACPLVANAVDSKAMRKVGADEDVAVVVVNSNASHGARFSAVGRFLVKLH